MYIRYQYYGFDLVVELWQHIYFHQGTDIIGCILEPAEFKFAAKCRHKWYSGGFPENFCS